MSIQKLIFVSKNFTVIKVEYFVLLLVLFKGTYSIPMEVFMHVRFADVDENFIKTEVQSGFYTNGNRTCPERFCRMREEKERAKHFQEAVNRGVQAVDRGETVVLTPDLLHERWNRNVIRKAKNEEPYSIT